MKLIHFIYTVGQPENLSQKPHEMNQFHGIFGVFSESKILIFLENILKFFHEIDLFDITSFIGLYFFIFSGPLWDMHM